MEQVFLFKVDVGNADQGRYSRARKVIAEVRGTGSGEQRREKHEPGSRLSVYKYWKYIKGKANINMFFCMHHKIGKQISHPIFHSSCVGVS